MSQPEIAKCRGCLGTKRTRTNAGGAVYPCGFCAGTGFDFDALPDPRVQEVLGLYKAIVQGSKQSPQLALIPDWLISVHREGNSTLNGWLHSGLFDGGGSDRYRYIGNYFTGYHPGLQLLTTNDSPPFSGDSLFLAFLIDPMGKEFLIKVLNWAKVYVLSTFDPKISRDPLDYIEF